MSQKSLIFATANQHKLSEIKKILPDFQILGLKDIGLHEEIEETGQTLEENAAIKVNYLYLKTKKMSLSEDTGLEVDALNGAPGVHTARYAGEEKDPQKNMQKLLQELAGHTNRGAQFRTVIGLHDGKVLRYFEGIVRGKIATEISGKGGFGYDPIFIPDGFDHTFGELDDHIKNTISHRAKAVQQLSHYLQELQP